MTFDDYSIRMDMEQGYYVQKMIMESKMESDMIMIFWKAVENSGLHVS